MIYQLLKNYLRHLSSASLRMLLVVPFVLQIFAAVTITGGLAFYNAQEAVNDLASQLRNEVTTRIQERIQNYLEIPHQVNRLEANDIFLGELNIDNIPQRERHFWQQLNNFNQISHHYMAMPDGQYFGARRLQDGNIQVIMRNKEGDNQYFSVDTQGQRQTLIDTQTNYDPRLRPWYQSAIDKGQATWSQIYPDFSSKSLAITATYPVYNEQNHLQGVLGSSLTLSWINDFLSRLKIGKTGQTFVMDRKGLLVASSTHTPVLKKIDDKDLVQIDVSEANNTLIKQTADFLKNQLESLNDIRESRPFDFYLNGTRQFLQVTPFQDKYGLDWLIVAVVPESDFMGRVEAITQTSIWMALVALLLGILGGVLTSRWVIRPIRQLNNAAKSLAQGQWEQSIDIQRNDELGQLAESFKSMAEQLKESFRILEDKNTALQKLDELKDEFLANTSHELRTPLNGIVGIAESMCDGAVGSLTDIQRKNLLMIAQSGHRLTNLVNDILDFSKLKHNNIELNLRSVGLREITEVVLTLSQSLVGDKKLKLFNKIPADLPPAKADENRLQQILYNLIGNAIKFTDTGKVEIIAEKIKENHQEWLALSVIDTGMGIPANKLDSIFESFEQGDGSNTRQYGGTGLGLTVTKQLVELHQGTIKVSSEINKGSRFTVTLPIADSLAENTSHHRLATVQRYLAFPEIAETVQIEPSDLVLNPDASRFTILIVDDEPINRQVLLNHLSLQHYAVVEAGHGPEALELVNDGLKPHLVLLDVMMPKMTGYEVCRRLREKFPANEVPILLLTAKTQVASLVEGLDAGANDYLTKPISKNELLARIKTHLQLSNLNIAYGRFVPHQFIQLMDKQSVVDVKLGDHVEKEMTILFSDIRGFTSISETMKPQENFDFINAYLSRMEPIIAKHNGFIDKYIGDAIMALFPMSVDNAVQAAVRMLQRLLDYNSTRGRPGRPLLKIGIGIHTGWSMLGTVGGENRMDGTVIADAVNLASRTEGMTKIYDVALLITEQVYQKLQNPSEFKIRVIDRVKVKGKTIEVTLYEVFDGDPPILLSLKQKTLKDFEQGFRFYHNQQISAALACFQRVLYLNPEDHAAKVYLDRCKEHLS
jgi:signal transduction histidine kinase/class 3 adenylate cyclase/ActR/RegA family two-component response regulator